MEKQLLRLCLLRQFWLGHLKLLAESLKYLEASSFLKTLEILHSGDKESYEVDTFRELHFQLNPAMTTAAKNNYDFIFDDLRNTELISVELGEKILEICYKREIARKIAKEAIDVCNGKTEDLDGIKRILEESPDSSSSSITSVDESLDSLLSLGQNTTRWKFNIATLANRVEGIGPNTFTIIGARPEVGKTALWTSFCASPGGFCSQGAKVVGFCNEESAYKTLLRAYSAFTGMSLDEIKVDKEAAVSAYAPLKGLFKLYDIVNVNMNVIMNIIETEHPDIIVIDQMDKVPISGDFARTDERLKEIYVRGREIAKKNDAALIAISQLSAEAQDRQYVDFSMLENSKTGKGAEGDLILCVGYNPIMGDGRTINISKNKISGNHDPVTVQLISKLSRYIE